MFSKILSILLIALLFSCSKENNNPVIKFSKDSTFIIINKIEPANLLQVKKYLEVVSDTSKMLSVYLDPINEIDSLNFKIIEGNVYCKGDSVIFSPKKPFVKGCSYLVESFIGIQPIATDKLLKGEVKMRVEPQRQVLKR